MGRRLFEARRGSASRTPAGFEAGLDHSIRYLGSWIVSKVLQVVGIWRKFSES